MIVCKRLRTLTLKQRLIGIVLMAAAVPSLVAGLSVYASPKLMAPPPPLPASFHGHVTVNGASVPSGAIITVGHAGVIYAQKETSMYAGASVYLLNVPADNPDTPGRDGGTEGEALDFAINGLAANESVAWYSGGSTVLDLSASGVLPTIVPPTPTSTPRFIYLPVILKQR